MSMFAGSVVAMGAPGQGSASLVQAMIPFVMIIGVIYFILIRPQQQQRKKVDEFLGALKVGDRIITTGGIYGQIVKINEQSIQLQIAPTTRIEVARAAIGGYQGQPQVAETTN
jgi:preprotein translocase subunit YajC